VTDDQLCGATWWHVEERAGQRVTVHHRCGKLAGIHHGQWHTCYQHGATERMDVHADRVKPQPVASRRT